METDFSSGSLSSDTSQPRARIPILAKVSALIIWAAVVALIVLFVPLLREKHPKLGMEIYACLAAFGVGLLVFIIGSVAKSKRRSVERTDLVGITENEIASEQNTLIEVPLARALPVLEWMNSQATPAFVVDLVLAENVLALIHRYAIPANHRTAAMLSGGLIGMAIESRVQKSMKKGFVEQAEKKRAEEQNMPLIQQLQRSALSFVIPVQDIQCIEKDDQGMVTVLNGFERIGLGVSDDYEASLRQWLEEARTRNGLAAEDPPPLSRKEIDEWAKSPGMTVPKEVEAEFAALEGRPAIQKSLAAGSSLALAKAIRAMPRPSKAAVQVRHYVLQKIVDSHMSVVGIGMLCLIFATPVAVVTIGASMSGGKADLMTILIAGLCSLLSLIGVIALPVFLALACRADAEGRK